MANTRLTELDAVNKMLGTIGDHPVNAIDGSVVNAQLAQNTLEEVSRQVQSRGWYFNTEYDVPLAPDASDNINIADNVIKFVPNPEHFSQFRLEIRGTKLYDLKNRTSTITSTIKATISYFLDFTDLPQQAREYIASRAARVFVQRFLNDAATINAAVQEESLALRSLQEMEISMGKWRFTDGMDDPTGFESEYRDS